MGSLGAVVVGGYVNGLGLVRALAARNIRTAVVATKPYDIAWRSRCVSAHDRLMDIEEQPERLVALLERRAADWAGWAVFPANDGALAALAQHHDRLSSTFRVVAPPRDVARYFLEKPLLSKVACSVGVDVPYCYGPAEGATAGLEGIRFPVIVKPSVGYPFFSRFGCKLFAAHNHTELHHCISRLAEAGMPGEVFDLIPGSDSQIYAYCTYIGAHGEPRGGLTVRKLRQSPPSFGVACVAEIVEDIPSLREATIEILRRIGFRGMAAAEFKRDPRDGRFRLLEINGRSVIYNALLRRGGLDLGALAWADYVGGHDESARPNGWPGVWIHLHADVLYSLLFRRQHRLTFSDLAAPYLRPKIYAVWSATDPLPFFTQWLRTASAGMSAIRHGRYRQLLADRAPPVINV